MRQAVRQPAPTWRRHLGGRFWIFALGLLIIAVAVLVFVNQRHSASSLAAGSPAPRGTFVTLNGQTVDVSSLRGKPTLLWFITTWCSSCQAGAPVVAENLAKLKADGVRVVTLELYNNLGGQGPDIGSFAQRYAGRASHDRSWVWGTASQQLSFSYDPKAYLDIYYLLDSQGHVAYISGSPGSTMDSLLQAAGQVT
jgi:thiol-disulfide isomerase/thioredoxin